MNAYAFPYGQWRQASDREPTDWEMSLASAIESAFSKGHWELDALVAALNESRVRPRAGGRWSPDILKTTMSELGA